MFSHFDCVCMQYKSAGDQLLRRDMSAAQREQLSALLEGIYESFVTDVAESRGRTRQEVLLGMILRLSLGEGLGASTNMCVHEG